VLLHGPVLNLSPSPMLSGRGPGASRAHGVRLPQGRPRRPAPVAAFPFAGQSFYALLEKPLHPLVHKAPADPDRGGNVRDRHAISKE
jgi:hypothetical protein